MTLQDDQRRYKDHSKDNRELEEICNRMRSAYIWELEGKPIRWRREGATNAKRC